MSSVNAVVGPLSGSPSGSAGTANNRQPYSHWTLEVNYYKRHLGDYAKDTGHLSALEHGVYTLLLDWYYSNERPIPAEKAIRIARGNPQETESVLSEYFHLTAEGWRHHRADREIADYHQRAETNRATGRLGGRPRKNPEKTETVSATKPSANPEITLATSHKPVSIRAESKALVQPTAALSRFADFWATYPNKKGRKDAERHWKREGCDAVADQIIGHVQLMLASDDGWRRGYVPMGSTYVNGRRWEDRPTGPPQAHSSGPSKGMQAIMNLEALKSDGLAKARNRNGFAEADFSLVGSQSGNGLVAWDGGGMDGDFDFEPDMG